MPIRVKIGDQILDMPTDKIRSGDISDLPADAKIEVYRNGQRGFVPLTVENYNEILNSEKTKGPYRFSTLEDEFAKSRASEAGSISGEVGPVSIPGGVLQGMPLAEVGMRLSGVPSEQLESVQQAQPGAYWGTKIGSSIAISLLPGGAVGKTIEGSSSAKNVANALLSGVKVLGIQDRMPMSVGNIATEKMASSLAKGALGSFGKKAANTLARSSAGAFEGAFMNAPIDAMIDSFVYDTKFKDEIVDGLVLRSILGAAIPGATGAMKDMRAGKLAKAATKQATVAREIAEQEAKLRKSGASTLDEGLSTKPDVEARALDGNIPHYGTDVSDHAKAAIGISKEVNQVYPILEKVPAMKKSVVGKAFGESPDLSPSGAISDAAEVSDMLRKLSTSPGVSNGSTLRKIANSIESAVDRNSEDQVGLVRDVFFSLDDGKKALGKLAKKNQNLQEQYDNIRERILNKSVYGEKVTELQRLNEAWNTYLENRTPIEKMLLSKFVPGVPGSKDELFAKSVSDMAKKAGDPLQAQKAHRFVSYMLSMKNFALESMKRGYITDDEYAKVSLATTRAANAMQAAINTPLSKKSNVLYDAVSASVGAGLGGFAGAAAGPIVGRYAKPAVMVGKELAKHALDTVAEWQSVQIGKNIAKFLTDGIRPNAVFQVASFGPEKDTRKPEEIHGRLSDQESMLDSHPTNDSEGALRAIGKAQVLVSMAPKDPRPSKADEITGRLPRFVGGEGEKFRDDAVRLAEFPGFVSYLMLTGRLTPKHIQVLEAVHPDALKKIRDQVFTFAQIMGKDLGHQQKQQLSVLMGEDMDKSVSKRIVSAIQNVYSKEQNQRKDTIGLPAKMSKQLSDTSERTQMSTQRLEAGI